MSTRSLRDLKEKIRLLEDRKALESIGEKIIVDKIRRSIDVRKGIKPDSFSTALIFKKGDIIPEAFRGLPNIKVDMNGVLQQDWSDWWCQYNDDSGGGWGECWDNSANVDMPGGFHTVPSERVATAVRPTTIRRAIRPSTISRELSIQDFTPEERRILERIGIRLDR